MAPSPRSRARIRNALYMGVLALALAVAIAAYFTLEGSIDCPEPGAGEAPGDSVCSRQSGQ